MAFGDKRRERFRARMDRHLAKLEKRLLVDTRGPRITVKAAPFEIDDYLARGWVVDDHHSANYLSTAGAIVGIDRVVLEERHRLQS